MTLRLYVFPPSPRALKVMTIASHLRLPHELRLVNLFGGDQNQPEYVALNPNRRMPVMWHDGFVLWEANAIAQYLAAARPEAGLGGSNMREQAEINRWQFWDLAHWEPALGTLIHEHMKKRALTGEGPDPEAVRRGEDAFDTCARILEERLQQSAFVAADRITVADFSLAAFLTFAEPAHMPIDPYSNLRRWHSAVTSLPAWSDARARGQTLTNREANVEGV